VLGAGAQQLAGAPAQRARRAAAALVELVLDAAVVADMSADGAGRQPGALGAIGAGGGPRAGRGDQAARLPAAGAGAAVAQGGGVAGVADRALGPADGRWAILAAVRADRPGARTAGRAGRAARAEVGARAAAPATHADRLAAPETRVADLGFPGTAADRDPPDPLAAPAAPLRAVGAARADRAALVVAGGDRFDHPAAGAGGGQLAGATARTHPAGVGAGQRPVSAPATGAGRLGQHRPRAAQRSDQPPDHRWRAHEQGMRVGGQRRGQFSGHRRMGRHGVQRAGGAGRRQRRVRRGDRGEDLRAPVHPGQPCSGGGGATRARRGAGGGPAGVALRGGGVRVGR